MMLRHLLIICLILCSGYAQAQNTYYFSINGSDSRTMSEAANNQSRPFKSLAKAQAIMPYLKNGDRLLFRRGDTFYGSLDFNNANVDLQLTVGAYGSSSNPRPVLTGFQEISTWTCDDPSGNSCPGNVWEASLPITPSDIKRLVVNGKAYGKARFPNPGEGDNDGYVMMISGSNKNRVKYGSNPDLPNDLLTVNNRFVGGEIVIRTTTWLHERRIVNSQSNGTINISDELSYDDIEDHGFFIQNHPLCLDQDNEWIFTSNTLKFYSKNNPNTLSVQYASVDHIISIVSHNNITIENVVCEGSNSYGLFIDKQARTNNKPVNIQVRNCVIRQTGRTGVYANNTVDFVFENNVIRDAGGNGLFNQTGGNNSLIRQNEIRQIGMIPGLGEEVALHIGMIMQMPNSLVELNTLDSIGYNGIQIGGTHTVCRKNFIQNFCMVLTDGAGIYGYAPRYADANDRPPPGDNQVISENIILNANPEKIFGVPSGLPPQINGIYIDYQSQNVEVSKNTISNTKGSGIHLHASRNISFLNNLVYDCGLYQMELREGDQTNKAHYPFDKGTITGNKLVAKTLDQDVFRGYWTTNNIRGDHIIDNNYYCNVFNKGKELRIQYNPTATDLVNTRFSLEQWSNFFNFDQNTKQAPIHYKPYRLLSVGNVEYFKNPDFEERADPWFYRESDGIFRNGSLEWIRKDLDAPRTRSNFGSGKSVSVETEKSSNNVQTSQLRFVSILDYRDNKKIEAGKNYILSLDVQAESIPNNYSRAVEVKPFKMSESSTMMQVGTSPEKFEWVFNSEVSSDGQIIDGITFYQSEFDGKIFYDNISLKEAEVEWLDMEDFYFFDYALQTPKTSTLGNYIYTDLDGNYYLPNSSLSLEPFESEILIRVDQSLISEAERNKLPVRFDFTKQEGGATERQVLDLGGTINYITYRPGQTLNVEAVLNSGNTAGIQSFTFEMDYFNDKSFDAPIALVNDNHPPFLLSSGSNTFTPPASLDPNTPHRLKISAYNVDNPKTSATRLFTTEILFYATPEDIYLEAECAQVDLGLNWEAVNDAGATQGQAIVYRRNGQGFQQRDTDPGFASPDKVVSFQVMVPETGKYHVWARVKAPSGQDDSFWVRLNGSAWQVWGSNFNVPSYSSNYKWVKMQAGSLNSPLDFSKGMNTLEFTYRENGTYLDQVFISSNASAPLDNSEPLAANVCNEPVNPPAPPPPPAPSAGQFYLEAECTNVGSAWTKVPDADADNGYAIVYNQGNQGFIQNPNDPNFGSSDKRVTFSFDLPSSGNYYIWVRVKTPSKQDDSFWVRQNGGSWRYWWQGLNDPRSASAYYWVQLQAEDLSSPLTYSAGSQTLEFTYRENGAYLDKILVSDSDVDPNDNPNINTINLCTPNTAPPSDFYLEAECATVGSEWSIVTASGASEGRSVVYNQGPQGFLQNRDDMSVFGSAERRITFQFDIPTTDNYHVWVRVRTPNASDDSFWVRTNGGPWRKWWQGFSNPQYSNDYQWVRLQADQLASPVNFMAGTNTLSFTYRENGAYLDKVFIGSSGATPSGLGGQALVSCNSNQVQTIFSQAQQAPEANLEMLRMYPNPVDGHTATLYFDQLLQGDIEYTIRDRNGVIVAKGMTYLEQPADRVAFNFSKVTLAMGIYYLSIKNAALVTSPIRFTVR